MKNLILGSVLVLVVGTSPLKAETYEITIENLTKRQLFSSPVCIVHDQRFSLFEAGSPASRGLERLAEDGETVLNAEVQSQPGVRGTAVGPLINSRSTDGLVISGARPRYLSCASMLGSTNDGFFALRRVALPLEIGRTKSVRARVYDSGSEVNSESCNTVPSSPCGRHFARDTEGAEGVVLPHPGLTGIGDLAVEEYGWNKVVAKIKIKRVQ